MSPWKSTSFLYWFLGAGKPWISHIASGSRLLFPGFHFWDGLGKKYWKIKRHVEMYEDVPFKQTMLHLYIYNMFIYFIHIDFLHITNNSGLWGSWKPRNTCPAISFHQRTSQKNQSPGPAPPCGVQVPTSPVHTMTFCTLKWPIKLFHIRLEVGLASNMKSFSLNRDSSDVNDLYTIICRP